MNATLAQLGVVGEAAIKTIRAIDKLDKINPDWNHPLLSQHALKAKMGNCSNEELKKYCKKALYSNPLHKETLTLAEGLEDNNDKIAEFFSEFDLKPVA